MTLKQRRDCGPKIPKVISHYNMDTYLDEISRLPCYQPGGREDPPAWVHQEVILEIPLGELCEDWLKTLALNGRREKPEVMSLTGKEGFDAQGLEGKVRIRKDLFAALMNMRDLIKLGRGRILRIGVGEDGQ